MTDDFNTDKGKISGKSTNSPEPNGKIKGISTDEISQDIKADNIETHRDLKAISRKDRISQVTKDKGLKSLPPNFGDSDGDWKIIESDNLFEVLYLDYHQIISINPEIAKNNFAIIEIFWKEKKNLWESGSVQIRNSIEDKYGKNNLSNCLKKLEYAIRQLSSNQLINDYYLKLKEKRMKIGEGKLEALFNMMLKDGIADPSEIENIFEEGLKIDLNDEEIASIIKKTLDSKEYVAYGNPSGQQLKDQLLSVSWMTEEAFKIQELKDEETKRRGREIIENKLAYSIEDIGEILFNNEADARQYIKDGLIVNSIDYFSPVKAKQFIEITKTQKNEYLRYLQIVYRLNPKLPYRFSKNLTLSLAELCSFFLQNYNTFKLGKEQYKQGTIEIWLKETQKDNYQKFVKIRDSAANVDLAYLEFLYTFNPKLPYLFAGKYMVNTTEDLCKEINKNIENWKEGKKELFNSMILVWLKTIGRDRIIEKWNKIKKQVEGNENVGLETFLHLLDSKLIYPDIVVNKSSVSFPKIQSGSVIVESLLFENITRGYTEGEVSFSNVLDGVTLSSDTVTFNNIIESDRGDQLTITIDSRLIQKGIKYDTTIQVLTSSGQKLEIPLSIKVIFPRNAFIAEIIKYAAIIAAFLSLIRLIISASMPDWLNLTYDYFLNWDNAYTKNGMFSVFAWAFLLFITGISVGGYFLFKYLISKKTKVSTKIKRSQIHEQI